MSNDQELETFNNKNQNAITFLKINEPSGLKDTESFSAKTEDSLLNNSSSNNSENASFSKQNNTKTCCQKCGLCCSLTTGVIFTTIGVLFLIWTPFYILMEQRLDMTPGLPAFEWWKTPPDEVYLRIYVFNVTNSEKFLNGTDNKIRLQELEPIIYLERLVHTDVVHNENSTLSYTAIRSAIYKKELNKIDINSTIVIPNFAVLGIASYMSDRSFFSKLGFNMLMRSMKPELFIKTTIYNFLWNQTDTILSIAKQFAPHAVNDDNMGVLNTYYNSNQDRSTVFIGRKFGHKRFFLLEKFDGSEYLKGPGESCPNKVTNSTEGALYPQYLDKNMLLFYYRRTLCRVIPLSFEKEHYMEEYNVMSFKYKKPRNAYDRKKNISEDCNIGDPPLIDGLSDVSKCYNGISMAVSYPHFLYGNEELSNMVEGLNPNETKHESYTFVEPLTGVPITSVARSQSNFIAKDFSTFSENLQKFSNLAIPMFWLEYEQEGLPYYVKNMMNFTVNTLPNYQYYFIAVLLFIGIVFLITSLKNLLQINQNSNRNNYSSNTNIHFEKQNFLK